MADTANSDAVGEVVQDAPVQADGYAAHSTDTAPRPEGEQAAVASSAVGGIYWMPLQNGESFPRNAVMSGATRPDGLVYVGRAGGEVGKINIQDTQPSWASNHMQHFWSHKLFTSQSNAEVLCSDTTLVWRSISRGDPIPEKAVLAYPGESPDSESGSSSPSRANGSSWTNFMNKAGFTPKQGTAYVARFNGEPGMVMEVDGCMKSFWSHWWKEQGSAEILIADPTVQVKEPMRIRVLQFNIWQEGFEVEGGFEKIVEAILACRADVVALSEVRNWSVRGIAVPFRDFHAKLKAALKQRGHIFHGTWVEGNDVGLISRWPIDFSEPVTIAKRSFISAYHIRTPAGVICVCSAHLDWKEYALNLVRGYDGNTFMKMSSPVLDVGKLLAKDADSGRGPALKDYVSYAACLKKMPMILAGDFNECSHLDWTDDTKDMYGHAGVAIEWQHSKILQDAGFIDSWRELYPNPVTHMGATWPSPAYNTGCTSWAKSADERDRIDFVYYSRKRLQAMSAHLVGPPDYYIKGKLAQDQGESPFLEESNLPWPSDHKGVLVEFELSPAVLEDAETWSRID